MDTHFRDAFEVNNTEHKHCGRFDLIRFSDGSGIPLNTKSKILIIAALAKRQLSSFTVIRETKRGQLRTCSNALAKSTYEHSSNAINE